MSLITLAGFAQGDKWNDKVGQWNAGIVIGYGTDISKPSFGIRGVYDIVNAFSVAGSFNYYLKDSEDFDAGYASASADLNGGTSMWTATGISSVATIIKYMPW